MSDNPGPAQPDAGENDLPEPAIPPKSSDPVPWSDFEAENFKISPESLNSQQAQQFLAGVKPGLGLNPARWKFTRLLSNRKNGIIGLWK